MAGHLPLADQLFFTSGGCAAFAIASQGIFVGELEAVLGTDSRTLKAHDHPAGVRFPLHAYLRLPDGRVLDAEGIRSERDMLFSFGILPGYKSGIARYRDADHLISDFGDHGDLVKDAARLMRHTGWIRLEDVPVILGTGELSKNFKKAQKELDARHSAAPTPIDVAPSSLDLGNGIIAVRDGEIYRMELLEWDENDADFLAVMERFCAFRDDEAESWDVPASRVDDLQDLADDIANVAPYFEM